MNDQLNNYPRCKCGHTHRESNAISVLDRGYKTDVCYGWVGAISNYKYCRCDRFEQSNISFIEKAYEELLSKDNS